jgi:hypothetical protein
MAQAHGPTPPPLTEEAFIADRQNFWKGFTSFTIGSVGTVTAVLVLMAVFLL